MTREECIKWLESLKTEIGRPEYRALWHYAKIIDITMEALLAEATGDLISRASALEEMAEAECGCSYSVCVRDNCSCSYIARIKMLPSADAVSREDYHNLLMASNDIDRALREYQEKEEQLSAKVVHKPDYSYEADMVRRLKEAQSVEAKDDLISRRWLFDLYAIPEDGDDVEWKVPLEVVRQNILDAPSAEAAQGVGRYEKAMQKLREMPRYLNGIKVKQIKKVPSEAVLRNENESEVEE